MKDGGETPIRPYARVARTTEKTVMPKVDRSNMHRGASNIDPIRRSQRPVHGSRATSASDALPPRASRNEPPTRRNGQPADLGSSGSLPKVQFKLETPSKDVVYAPSPKSTAALLDLRGQPTSAIREYLRQHTSVSPSNIHDMAGAISDWLKTNPLRAGNSGPDNRQTAHPTAHSAARPTARQPQPAVSNQLPTFSYAGRQDSIEYKPNEFVLGQLLLLGEHSKAAVARCLMENSDKIDSLPKAEKLAPDVLKWLRLAKPLLNDTPQERRRENARPDPFRAPRQFPGYEDPIYVERAPKGQGPQHFPHLPSQNSPVDREPIYEERVPKESRAQHSPWDTPSHKPSHKPSHQPRQTSSPPHEFETEPIYEERVPRADRSEGARSKPFEPNTSHTFESGGAEFPQARGPKTPKQKLLDVFSNIAQAGLSEAVLPADATDEHIKKTFRKVCLKTHPDKNPSPALGAFFKALTEAYSEYHDHPSH